MTSSEPLNVVVSHVMSKDDFPAIVDVEDQAFQSSKVIELMFPTDPASHSLTTDSSPLHAHNHQVSWSTDPSAHYLKASLPSGKIIGMAKWNFFLDSGPQYPWQHMEFPPNTNKGLCEFYFGGLDAARNGWMEGEKHALMAILVVLPQYQRMGVGKKLLRWGLERVDKEGLGCWIDASPFGLGLYKKFGWEEVGGLDVELEKWGGEKGKISRTVNMVRKPQPVVEGES